MSSIGLVLVSSCLSLLLSRRILLVIGRSIRVPKALKVFRRLPRSVWMLRFVLWLPRIRSRSRRLLSLKSSLRSRSKLKLSLLSRKFWSKRLLKKSWSRFEWK